MEYWWFERDRVSLLKGGRGRVSLLREQRREREKEKEKEKGKKSNTEGVPNYCVDCINLMLYKSDSFWTTYDIGPWNQWPKSKASFVVQLYF